MRRVGLRVLIVALTALSASDSRAAGSFQKPQPQVVKAGMPSVPSPSMPNATATEMLGGCGRGRIRDPQTHGCRGPADIR